MQALLRHLALLLAAATLSAALPVPASAAVFRAAQYYRPKDFSLIKKDGVYHLFYIRHSDLLAPWASEVDFGHATSRDLFTWTHQPEVLPIDPAGWDNAHVWAPHIVESQGLYWMFYTGVTERPGLYMTQRMGVAVSSDLVTWNRIKDHPIWSNEASSWAWWSPMRAAMACRDPFVMPDPAAPGRWLMYYTATPASDTLVSIVGVARSEQGSLGDWEDAEPLWITHHSLTFNTLAESPHLFKHNGRWFLFMTSNAGQPLTFYTSANPTGAPSEWTYRGRLRNMLGYDTHTWAASEVLHDGKVDYFAHVNDDHIEIHRMVWGVGDNFSLDEVKRFHMVSMGWTSSVVAENRLVGLRLQSANPSAFANESAELVAFTRDASGWESPVPMSALGLPSRPALDSDSVVIPWYTRRWPPTKPETEAMPLRVALSDGTASTPWLLIPANPVLRPDDPPRPRTMGDSANHEFAPPDDPPPIPEDTVVVPRPAAPGVASREPAAPRVLHRTPLGDAPAVVFELTSPADVRAEVFDLQGRRIATLAERTFGAGTHVLAWDGRDATGPRAPCGLYFVRLLLPGRAWGLRLILED